MITAIDGRDVPIRAESICVHGDSPGAMEMAAHLRRTLDAAGVTLKAFA